MLPNSSSSLDDLVTSLIRWYRFLGPREHRFEPNRCVIGLYLRRRLPWPAFEDLDELSGLIVMEAPDLLIPQASLLQRAGMYLQRLGGSALAQEPVGGRWHPVPRAVELAALADLVELEAPHAVVSVASLWQMASMCDERIAAAATTLALVHKDLHRIMPGSSLAALAAHTDLERLLGAPGWSTPPEVLGEDHAVADDLLRLARVRAVRARGGAQLGLLNIAYKLGRRS